MSPETEVPACEVRAPWRMLRRGTTKVAFSLNELVTLTSDFSLKYAQGCNSTVIRTDPAKFLFVYRVVCHKKDKNGKDVSDPNGHVVRMKFDFSRLKETGTVDDLDVRLSCSCVAPDTWVRMADGTEKAIKDVIPGDMVLTHKGRARKVTHVATREAKPGELAHQLSVEGYREPLVLSEDHPVAVVRGHETCACGCGSPLLSFNQPRTLKQQWGRAFIRPHVVRKRYLTCEVPDYSEGRALWRTPDQLWDYEHLYFPRPSPGPGMVDPDLAALAGYYAAEGSLTYHELAPGYEDRQAHRASAQIVEFNGSAHSLTGVTFGLHQKERDTLASDIVQRVGRLFPDAATFVTNASSGLGLVVRVTSPALAHAVYSLVGKMSSEKRLSPELMAWAPESLLEFVAAWALGDGHCSTTLQSGATTSRHMATQLSTILHSLGVPNALTYWDQSGNRQRAYRLSWSYLEFPQVVLQMAARMQPDARERVEHRLRSVKSRNHDKMWGDGYLKTLSQHTVTPAPEVFYDLTVDEDQSFIANGILVHNCPAWLYWGAQWNTATGDALYGAPRPKFQPPTDPQRYSNILCKHVKVVADRIGPVLERVLSSHRNKKDRATQEQNLKDIELEKQRTQQEVEELSAQPNVPVPDTTPQSPTAPALDDNDLGDLTLPSQRHAPPKPNPENLLPESLRKLLKLPTAPGQKPPTPEEAPEPTPEPAPAPEPPKAGPLGAQVVKDKSPGRQVTPNLTVYDDEDDTATVLPGSMGALVKKDKATKPPTPPKPAPIVRDKDTEGRKLPPNIKLIDDDDDSTIKINSSLHRMMASLVLADEEAPAAGPLGALLLSTRKTPITGSLAALVIASRATSTPIA